MCAQPRNPEPANDDSSDIPAPAEHEQRETLGSATNRQPRRRVGAGSAGRNLVVRGVRRDPPDIRKLARVVAILAADMLANEPGGQAPPAEADSMGASNNDLRRDAA